MNRIPLAFVVTLAACASTGGDDPRQVAQAMEPVGCIDPIQCELYWQRAKVWISSNSYYRVQLSSDSVIETYGPYAGRMAVQAQQLPVAAIGRVVVVIVIAMMNGELAQVGTREFACAATTNPRIDLERLLPVSLAALCGSAAGLGHDAVQLARVFHDVSARADSA